MKVKLLCDITHESKLAKKDETIEVDNVMAENMIRNNIAILAVKVKEYKTETNKYEKKGDN